jgi:hypothetical protein
MYVLVETSNYATKNKLQKEVFEFLRGEERKTFKGKKDVEEHLAFIKEKLAEINTRHARCKPLFLHVWNCSGHRESHDLSIEVYELIRLKYYFGIGLEK